MAESAIPKGYEPVPQEEVAPPTAQAVPPGYAAVPQAEVPKPDWLASDTTAAHPSIIEDMLKPAGRVIRNMGDHIQNKDSPGDTLAMSDSGLDDTKVPGQGPDSADFMTAAGAISPMSVAGNPLAGASLKGVGDLADQTLKAFRGNKGPTDLTIATPPARLSADKIQAKLLKDSGTNPDDIAATLAKTKDNPLPMTALDHVQKDDLGDPTGADNILSMVAAAGNKPGPASLLSRSMIRRGADQRQQFLGVLNDELSADSPYQLHDQALMNLQNEGRAAQEKAFNVAPVTSERLKDMMEDPTLQEGIHHGIRTQQIWSRSNPQLYPYDPLDFNVKFDDAGHPTYEGVPSMKTLDAGRKGLGAILDAGGDGIRNPTTGQLTERGAAIANLKSEYTDELKRLNPAYGDYLDTIGEPMEHMGAGKAGLNFMNMRPQEIEQFLNGNRNQFLAGQAPTLRDPASEGAKATFKAGAMESIANKLAQHKDDAYVLDSTWKQGVRDRLAPMLDNDSMSRLNAFVQDQRSMMRSNRAFGGSNTFDKFAANQQLQDSVATPGLEHAAGAVRFAAHPKRAALDFLSGLAKDKVGDMKESMSNDVAAELMKDWSSRDPAVWQGLAARLKNTK